MLGHDDISVVYLGNGTDGNVVFWTVSTAYQRRWLAVAVEAKCPKR
jgi:hypothetical protein